MKRQLLLIIIFAFAGLSVNAQAELLVNGNFASGSTGWTPGADWYCNSNYTNCCVCSGYAHADNGSGQPKANLNGYLEQTRTLPSTATSASLSFCTSATLSGSSTGTERIFVYIYDNTLSVTNSIATIYFPSSTSYTTYTYAVPSSCIGHSLTLGFNSKSSTTATTIRIDEVSLKYTSTTCATPTTQASSINFSGVGQTSMTANWSNGSGSRRVVYINTSNSFTAPSNGTDPTASASYNGGQQCIYNGTGSSVTVTNLTCATTYYVRVYEANCTGNSSLYYIATAGNNPNSQTISTCSCTTPTMQASNIIFSTIGQTSMTSNWTNGNGNRRVVYINTTNSFIAPSNGTSPTASTNYSGGQQCIYNGNSSSATVTGLTCATTYYVRVYEANCTGTSSVYYSSSATNNPNSQATSACSNGLLHGVDISAGNQTVAWSQIYTTTHSFAYIKATEGTSYPPSVTYFNSAITSSNPYGVVLGAYHYARPDDGNTALGEANYFLSIAGSYISTGYLPPALDMDMAPVESYLSSGHTKAQLAQWINDWCTQVYNMTTPHRWPVLYIDRCRANYIVSYYQNTIDSNIKLWIAAYPEPAGSPAGYSTCGPNWNTWPWVFHQYFAPGTPGNNPTEFANPGMDQDVFNGDQTAFNNLIGGTPSPTATITNFAISTATVCPCGTFTITDTINASSSMNIMLGASIVSTGTTNYINDSLNDIAVIVSTGINIKARNFKVPCGTAAGTYDVLAALWQDRNSNGKIDAGDAPSLYSTKKIGILTISSSISPSVIITFTSGSNPSCLGQSLTFTATALNEGNNPSYQWKVNGGNVGPNSSTFTTSSLTSGQQVITCEITSNASCANPATVTSNSLTITVNSSVTLTAAITLTSGSNPSCSGQSLTFSATAINGGSSPSYQWKVNGNPVGSNSATYTTSSLTNGQLVTCTITSNASCVNPSTTTSNSITVTVNSSVTPSAAITLSSGSNPSCSGQSLTFSATATNGGSSPSYQWKVNGNPVGSNSATYTTSSLTNGQVVSCVITSNSSCAIPITTTSNSITVTISASVTPSVSIALTSGTNPRCSGQPMTFKATPTNGGSGPSYQWKVNGNPVGSNLATYTTSSLTNGQVVTCVITSNSSCAIPITATSNSITVTISASVTPSVSIALTSGTDPSCSGQPLTFTATPTNGGSSPGYQWKVNGSPVGGNSANYTTSSLTNGQLITCIVTSNSPCASPTIATSNSVTVTVSATVTPSVSIALTSGSNPTCLGQSLTFTATQTNGGSNPSYQWKVNGSPVGSNSATYTTSSLTNGQVITCVITSNSSCASPTIATSNSVTITVSSTLTPVVSIVLTSGSNPTCLGQSLTFAATPTNGGTSPSYQWKVNGNPVGSNSATYTSSSLTNGQVVTCVVTSNSPCASPTTATSNSIKITISTTVIPSVSIALSSGSNPTCSGQSLTFTATPTNGGNGPICQWKADGNNVGTNSTAFTSSLFTDGQVITCVLTSNLSCASPINATSNGIILIVNPNPIVSAGQSQTYYANGNPVTIGGSPTASNGTKPYFYQWSPSTGLDSDTASNPTVSNITTNTTYQVIVTDSAGCSSTAGVTISFSDTSTSCLTPLSKPNINSDGCLLWTDSLPTLSYQWYLDATKIISGISDKYYAHNGNGGYSVEITSIHNLACKATSDELILNCPDITNVSIIEPQLLNLSIQPNPSNGNFVLSFETNSVLQVSITVYDAIGRIVKADEAKVITNRFSEEMNLENAAKGMYILQLQVGQSILNKKIVVQ